MRNLRFAHKQSEDALTKSVFEVLMKFVFPVSNGLVSQVQSLRNTNWPLAPFTQRSWNIAVKMSLSVCCVSLDEMSLYKIR